MKVLDPEPINLGGDLDLAEYLSDACDFEYTRDSNGVLQRPVVECDYVPKPDFNGATSKFRCVFQTGIDKKTGEPKFKKLKVKYDLRAGGGDKEIAQAIVGSGVAKLMGFVSHTFCPARVICKGCPSQDPWKQSLKSSAEPNPALSFTFENAVVERKVKGYEIMAEGDDPRRPQVINWRELRNVSDQLPQEERLAELAAREAWMLYLHLINHADSDPHNNGFVCDKATWNEGDPEPTCENSFGFQNDWGDSFNFMNLGGYKSHSTFRKKDRSSRLGANICVGTMNSAEGDISGARFSEESRQLFKSLITKVSREQILDLFELAQVRAISKGKTTALQWSEVFIEKIYDILVLNENEFESLRQLDPNPKRAWPSRFIQKYSMNRCFRFDESQTVLGPKKR
jgi:hypothetical protein